MRLITVDPGIDETGAAVFDTDLRRAPSARDPEGLEGAARALVDVYGCRTSARHASVARCRNLAVWMAELVEGTDAAAVWIELPPLWHARRQKGRRTPGKLFDALFKLNRAVGALAAGAAVGGAAVHEIPAAPNRKDQRIWLVNHLLRRIGREEVRHPDQADAVYIGLMVVREIP